MVLPIFSVVFGLALLLWSANRFIDGAASTARHFGMPALLIGIVIIGFGTSSPELLVSAISSYQGNSGLAIGNAYGSNIANIALILGVTAIISPINVHSRVLRKELPILTVATGFAAWQLWDGQLGRTDAVLLLVAFAGLMLWSSWQKSDGEDPDTLAKDVEQEIDVKKSTLSRSVFWLVVGLAFLIASSRILVWGAVEIAQHLGVSDLMIGLTVVAIGTSLPELASSIIAARKGAHDIAIGNVIGSNLFNTLAVVGLAGVITPISVDASAMHRDILVMSILTFVLFAVGYRFKKHRPGRINRYEGTMLLCCFAAYTIYLITGISG